MLPPGTASEAAEKLSRRRLVSTFYRRPTLVVARDLLGRVLCRRLGAGRILRGRIVEAEAYDGPHDRASHARCGRTQRNAPMFKAGGKVYVYRIYGMHHCLNVVTGEPGYPAAVLLRATETPAADRNASGPGRLCRAFEVDRALDHGSFLGRELWIEEGAEVGDREVRRTPRINIDSAENWVKRPYRFVIRGHHAASGPRRLR